MRKHRSHDVVPIDHCLIAAPGAIEEPASGVVVETVLHRQFSVEADGFWQVHPGAPTTLVETVLEMLAPQPGEKALDLYAGVGLFAAFLGERPGDLLTGVFLGRPYKDGGLGHPGGRRGRKTTASLQQEEVLDGARFDGPVLAHRAGHEPVAQLVRGHVHDAVELVPQLLVHVFDCHAGGLPGSLRGQPDV